MKHLDLEILDFSDVQQIEESIAPLMLMMVSFAGGSCTGGTGSGCICHPAEL